jgi:hypothetical protein
MSYSTITVSIPDDTVLERARAMAERQGRSLSSVVYRALREAVILDEGARAAAAGGFEPSDEAGALPEADAEAMEDDYRAASGEEGSA